MGSIHHTIIEEVFQELQFGCMNAENNPVIIQKNIFVFFILSNFIFPSSVNIQLFPNLSVHSPKYAPKNISAKGGSLLYYRIR